MSEINHHGGDWDMRTEGVLQSSRQLGEGVSAFEAAWQSAAKAINAGAGQLGQDDMGKNFRASFDPRWQGCGEYGSQVQPVLKQACTNADSSVSDYIEADRIGKSALDLLQ